MRNPLAPATFLLRNRGKSVPMMAVIMLAVMLVMSIVCMINSIPLSIRTIYSYSQYSTAVSPRGDPSMTPKIIATIEKCPHPIERIITCRASSSQVSSIVGKWPFVVLGMQPDDMAYVLKRMNVKSINGRLPAIDKPEVLISAPVAQNLKLKIGSVLQSPETQESYSPKHVKVVGIAQTDLWLMANGIEYQRANHFPPIDNVLVFAPDLTAQDKVDRWVRKSLQGQRAQVFAYYILDKQTDDMFKILYRILNVVIIILALVITLMMGMLINIYLSQRLVEFGLLQALGFTKKALLRRVLAETTILLGLGWVVGLGLGIGLLYVLKAILLDPSAFSLDPFDPVALRYTIPIPLTVAAVAFWTVWSRFRKFDPVSIVERRLV